VSAGAGPAPAPARDLDRPLPLLRAAREVFGLSLESFVWGGRSALMALLLGLPLVFAVLYRLVLVAKLPARVTGFDLYGHIVALYDVRNVVPLCALFFAASLIADEVEGKTLTYLITRPVPRPAILLGKFAAYVVTALVFVWPVTVVTFFLLATARGTDGLSARVGVLFQDLGVLALGLLAYGALFTLLGVLVRRPVIPGLLFLYGWELVVFIPGHLPRFTVTAYLRSLLSHRPVEEGMSQFFGQVLFGTGESLLALGAITLLALTLAFRIFSEREYVMEQ
jgi:ABC-type transport system involved in multi-copper enzyme maturation permease subunit